MASSTSTSPATTPAKPKVCFNSYCKRPLEQPRRGWRRRSGDFAELCDRCVSAYEEAKFCETFHLNASGWRCCETCGKQIHCGCIVSFHLFVLLDAGGIECITCTRKSFILTPNPAWPPPSLLLPLQSERVNDLSSKDWSPIAGSGPVPWRQAPSLFNGFSTKYELQGKTPFEIDVSGGCDRLRLSDRLCASSLEGKIKEDSFEIFTNRSLKPFVPDVLENADDGFKCAGKASACLSGSKQSCFLKNESSTPNINMNTFPSSKTEMNCQAKIPTTSNRSQVRSPSVGKQNCSHNGLDMSGENPLRTGKARPDVQARNRLLPRYWPRMTDQELQQISGVTNSVITPLFEKILSASDAGRIGRLVLPKKCAEAYLPPISQPEGVPLKVQDVKGNEWVFQFRFWPNNNSRMYVLEGVTPCIQAMQLQAGDIVIFSRREPEGRLVMGGRKTPTAPSSDQGKEAVSNGDGVSANGHINRKSIKPGEVVPASICSQFGKSGHGVKEITEAKTSTRVKRKNSTLASKTKRLRIENEDRIELKLTWKQAQGLIRPPPNNVPNVIMIEGYEFEEYEQGAPIIGRPIIPANDDLGGKVQWVQCEDCLKWRKIPADILLPSRWTCSANSWDPERSICLAAQEFTAEQLQDLLHTVSKGAVKRKRTAKQESDSADTLEGLDTLANLAIWEEGSSSQATTRHPRHKPGCSCIVCMQPPSGKGSKHKQPCDCIVCESLKRRYQKQMTKRLEKQQLEKEEAEAASVNLRQDADEGLSSEIGTTCSNQEVSNEDDDSMGKIVSASASKAGIDLNIQPERESPDILNYLWSMVPVQMERVTPQLKQSDSGGGGAS